jgi:putative nucleotidyltransferase with HDIG domain
MMTREEAFNWLKENMQNKNLIKHCLAVEVCMRHLARRLGEDEEKWSLAGLLHDIDYEKTKGDAHTHSQLGADMLAERGLPADIVTAVRVHNEAHGLPRTTVFDKALYAVDPLTGLIVAAALINPAKKLSAIDTDFVMKRFGEKAFARGANRDQIKSCDELGLSLEEFIGLGITAMQTIAAELEL